MADDSPDPVKKAEEAEGKSDAVAPTPKKSSGRRRTTTPAASATDAARKSKAKEKVPKAPRRPTLDPNIRLLLAKRDEQDDRRPKFTRQASYRYWRIGRWENWRTPRGVQSKQRRHYKYRSTVVSIGFGTPRKVRGLTPTGFRPIIVRTTDDLERLDVAKDAAIIARTVGTRRRLALEESARKLGVHLLNPLVKERGEE
jgi:large subunit ribosomal protein L32e